MSAPNRGKPLNRGTLLRPDVPFLGTDAIAAGHLSPYQLRTLFRRVFPNVYVAESCVMTPEILVRAAALWAPEGAVLGGAGAALLHRERWFAPESVMKMTDLYCPGTPRKTPGVRLRRWTRAFPNAHLVAKEGIRLTSAGRTAVDVGRWEDDDDIAIAKIDAVCNRGGITVSSLEETIDQMSGLHGVRRIRSLLRWCDERADSPPETRLRLMLICGTAGADPAVDHPQRVR